MLSRLYKSLLLAAVVTVITLSDLSLARTSTIGMDDKICDVSADAALGSEAYSQSIALHQRRLEADTKNALAHYHLGFAYGMVGQHEKELVEYREATRLGLGQWDLYLNLGRVYLENADYPAALDALQKAVTLEPENSETHFNLGLVYERQRRFVLAEQEMRTAMRLGADSASAANMLAVIYAQEGNQAAARSIWTGLVHHALMAEVARANLGLLDKLVSTPPGQESGALGAVRIAPASSSVAPQAVRVGPAETGCDLHCTQEDE